LNLSEVQIDGASLVHNLRALRGLLKPGAEAIAVVKGNAYGHGLAEVVRTLESEADGFQVDDIEELRALRALSNKRALVLGYIRRDDIEEALRLGAELSIFDLQRIPAIEEAGKRLGLRPKVHLKVDALLGRLGVLPADLPKMIEALKAAPQLELVSAYMHFANIEDTTDVGHAFDQSELFEGCLKMVRDSGWPGLPLHWSATSGAMSHWRGHMTRFGLGIYGMYPSAALARRHSELGLKPAMRWISHLAQVKTLPAHHPVGYGLTFITPREMTIGIVPQGYADGYDRGLSNSGEVLIQGARCSVLGRVAMNMFAVDLTAVPSAAPEDEVVLLGAQGTGQIIPEEIASRLGTINYEVTTRISPLLPRKLV